MPRQLAEPQCSRVSALIAERIGLHFPRERWTDLQRGLADAAAEFGFDDVESCADWLLREPLTKEHVQVLAAHLTVPETYFFRDESTLRALSQNILPDLIRSRRGRGQRLRLWSAACSSGEEAYSLAILVRELLPDPGEWAISIAATDISPRALRKAVAGIYGEWSFRGAAAAMKSRYFTRTSDGRYAIHRDIRNMVVFSHLNLADDVYPSLETDTNAMDVILCRNVLMYFTTAQMRKVIDSLHRSLIDGGWLSVSPSEASSAHFPDFEPVHFPGAIFFRKGSARCSSEPSLEPFIASDTGFSKPAPVVTETRDEPEDPGFAERTRALANAGRLAESLQSCEQWIAAERLNPAAHYVRAVVLIEQGRNEEAQRSLHRAIYLDPRFVLAHFALGNLARNAGRESQARKHFFNALGLLGTYAAEDPLPESDGLTAGRLAQTISSILDAEVAR